jgi:hypothetical protein
MVRTQVFFPSGSGLPIGVVDGVPSATASGEDAHPNGSALGTRDLDIPVAMGRIRVRVGINLSAGGLGAGGGGDLCTGGLPSQALLGEWDLRRTSPNSSSSRDAPRS